MHRFPHARSAVLAVLWALSWKVWPNRYAGNRIFPTTFEVDDPFVMDEFSLLVSHLKEPGTAEVPAQLGTGVSADYTARITEHWGVLVGGEFRRVQPDGQDAFHGFGNLLVGTKYQFFYRSRARDDRVDRRRRRGWQYRRLENRHPMPPRSFTRPSFSARGWAICRGRSISGGRSQ